MVHINAQEQEAKETQMRKESESSESGDRQNGVSD